MSADGYASPRSIDEAVALLTKNAGARVLAGGHSLLVEPGRRALAGTLLVDLGRIPGLAGIEPQPDGSLKIGAMTTLGTIAASDAVQVVFPALVEAARSMGDIQSRNRATLGGSLAAGDPESALTAVVLALDAAIDVNGPGGARTMTADKGLAAKALAAGDLITAVRVPAPAPRSGAAYVVFSNPATLYATCGIAAAVTLAKDGSLAACRVAVTGATDRPQRLGPVEKALAGKAPSADTLATAAASAGDGLTIRSDIFASTEYRTHLTRVLTLRALTLALERAGK